MRLWSHDHSGVIGEDLLALIADFLSHRAIMQGDSEGTGGQGHSAIPGMLSPDTLRSYVNSFALQDSKVQG